MKASKGGNGLQFYSAMTPMNHINDQRGALILMGKWWQTFLGSHQQLCRWTENQLNMRDVWYWKPRQPLRASEVLQLLPC